MMTPEEKQALYNKKQMEKLKEKKFKRYTFTVGQKKISDNADLLPYNCKNYVGNNNGEFFAQTNKGSDMAKKLILRQMRATRKENLQYVRAMRDDINMLKGGKTSKPKTSTKKK